MMERVPSGSPVLRVRHLGKRYRMRTVLHDLSLEVQRGSAVAVIGPNGAGKSTFFGCITGQRLPDTGTVEICGRSPRSDPSGAARCMGFVPEQPFLYGELSIGEMLHFVAEARGLPEAEAGARRHYLLERFGLEASAEILCRELSQGMGRKVAIIAALLHRPALLVLDEVFNGLDLSSAEALLEELEEHRRSGGAILLSSHDLPLLARWCDEGLFLAPHGWTKLHGDRWQEWRSAPSIGAR